MFVFGGTDGLPTNAVQTFDPATAGGHEIQIVAGNKVWFNSAKDRVTVQ